MSEKDVLRHHYRTFPPLPSLLPACLRPGRGGRTARTGSVCLDSVRPAWPTDTMTYIEQQQQWRREARTAAAAAQTSRDLIAQRQLCGINARRLSIEWIFLPFVQLCSILGYCPCFVSRGSSSSYPASLLLPAVLPLENPLDSVLCYGRFFTNLSVCSPLRGVGEVRLFQL